MLTGELATYQYRIALRNEKELLNILAYWSTEPHDAERME